MGEFSTDTIDLGTTGTGSAAGGMIRANLDGISDGSIATSDDLSIGTHGEAQTLMAKVDTALTNLNTMRGTIGSTQNRVESKVRNLDTTTVNLKAAESTIRDVDYAKESANFNKLNIISQAGTYAISQANSAQQNVMRLLQ